jgi:hypothetical protein
VDLLVALKNKIDALPDGPYTVGLAAVLLHIETAFKHYSRGESAGEDTAFTDAIYRTNQAFEGSVKEAYRVLAGKAPEKKTISDIEHYLETEGVFRSRVLSQFTIYRRDWRNPSTHDYKLDFDESESFIAIISVTAFACLILDQITARLSFEEARSETQANIDAGISGIIKTDISFVKNVEAGILEFLQSVNSGSPRPALKTETQFVGSLAGYLSSAIPNIQIDLDHQIRDASRRRVDIVASLGERQIAIEVKRTRGVTESSIYAGMTQLDEYLKSGEFNEGILIFFTPHDIEYATDSATLASGKLALIIRPVETSNDPDQFN